MRKGDHRFKDRQPYGQYGRSVRTAYVRSVQAVLRYARVSTVRGEIPYGSTVQLRLLAFYIEHVLSYGPYRTEKDVVRVRLYSTERVSTVRRTFVAYKPYSGTGGVSSARGEVRYSFNFFGILQQVPCHGRTVPYPVKTRTVLKCT